MTNNATLTTTVTGLKIKEIPNVLRSFEPTMRKPVVFDSPHSGQNYPAKTIFNYVCAHENLRYVEDTHVDDLIDNARKQGVTVLTALTPRSFVDLNRARDCLNPADIRGDWRKVQCDPSISHMAQIGSGVVPVKTGQGLGAFLYHDSSKPDADEINERLENFYDPYHEKLDEIIQDIHEEFGLCYHVNCHSMPRTVSLEDFVVGNAFGRSTDQDFSNFVRDTLRFHPLVKKNNWSVGVNTGIKSKLTGGEIIQRHGDPENNIHSVQLEVKRMHYMDENTRTPNAGYQDIKTVLDDLAEAVAEYALNKSFELDGEKKWNKDTEPYRYEQVNLPRF